jgi:hypothetical protein
LTEERLVSKIVKGILSVTAALKFHKAEARHDADIDDATNTVEELGYLFRTGVRRQTTKIKATAHCGRCGERRRRGWEGKKPKALNVDLVN